MNRGQRVLLRSLGITTSISVLLILYYNLSPSYVDEQGFLIEEFWAMGLASFGLLGSVVGLIVLLVWLWFGSRKAKNIY